MKKFYSIILTGVIGLLASQYTNAQSCDTLRNYNPADDFWQLSTATGFILGHDHLSDGTDDYDANYWSEPYNVTAATEVRAVRFVPWKIEDQGTVDSIAFCVWPDNGGVPDLANEISREWIRYDEMTASQYNLLEFSTPASVNGAFHVGYELNYDATQDSFALLGTQPATNYTQFQLQGPPGSAGDGVWFETSDVYTDGGGAPINTAFVLDVLTSTATPPTADFSITPASGAVCFGTDFQVDGSATTGTVDVYDWYLTDQGVTTVYDNDNTSGVTASLTPTISPSTQTIFLIADGGCVSDVVGYLVDVYDPVTATVGTTDPTCGNSNGEIDITGAAGGDGTYTYEITDGGGNTTSQGNGSFTNLAPDTYDIVVTTAGGGCEFTQTVTLSNIPPETITVGADETICNGSSVNLTASGNGTIEWFDGGTSVGTGTSVSVSPSITTTYDAVLTDANGCTDTDQLQVTVNPVNDASFSYSSNTLCLGGANETPTINGTGTFTSTPSGLVFADASTGEIDMANSAANTYDITFTTTGACGESETQAVTLTSSPDATFSYSAAEFCAETGTEVPTFPSGASAGTFTATPAGLSLNANSGEITLNTSSANTYTVTNTIAASGSCPQVSETATVTINALPTVDGGADQNVCEGTQVTLTATGADTYSWTGGISQGTAFTPTVGSTTYTVTGTDANNCQNTDDVIVTVDEEPVVDAGADQEVCEGEEVTLTATTSVGTISWDNGITDGTPFTPTATTTYTATATNGQCSVTDEAVVTVNPLPSVTTGADQTTCVNYAPIQLTGTPAGGTFSGTGVTGSEFDPGTAGVGTHTVTYTYTDGNGCENSATQEITVDGCASIEENTLDAIVVAPNPATTYVDIAVNGNELNGVQLVNATGQVIEISTTVESTKTRIDLNNVAKGTYFLQINTVNGQTTRRVVVQ